MVDELTIRYKDLCGISITNAIDEDCSRQLWGYIGHGNDSTLLRNLCNKKRRKLVPDSSKLHGDLHLKYRRLRLDLD